MSHEVGTSNFQRWGFCIDIVGLAYPFNGILTMLLLAHKS